MRAYRILFAVGKDRPGIVDEVSSLLFQCEANIEDSRMAAMGGCFAIMTLFSCPPERLPAVSEGLSRLESHGLTTALHEARNPEAVSRPSAQPLKIQAAAMDHPGIVQKIVHLLHTHRVNIQMLNTELVRAPLSGAPLFNLTLDAQAPPDESLLDIQSELNTLAGRENMDIRFLH